MNGIKPGYLTTEFWGKCVVQAITLANMFFLKANGHEVDPAIGLAIIGGIETLYGAYRAITKAFHNPPAPAAPSVAVAVSTPPAQ